MTFIPIDQNNSLYYEYAKPRDRGKTFVFINPLTGSTETWSGTISKELLRQGFGYLTFDFRGQGKSKFDPEIELDTKLIVSDLIRVLEYIEPKNIILVGLSIGGLYAALAMEIGLDSDGLVLINTLRKKNIRLEWINRTMVNVAGYGGTALLMDFNLPMIAGNDFLEKMKPVALDPGKFRALDKKSGIYKLMKGSLSADWDFDWSKLTIPTLIMTGHLDKVFRIPEDVDKLASKIPNVSRLEMPHYGHLIPMEAPELFSTEICDFANSISS